MLALFVNCPCYFGVLLNSLGGLLDGEIALDLGLVDSVDGDPGEVSTHHHAPHGVAHARVRIKVEQL